MSRRFFGGARPLSEIDRWYAGTLRISRACPVLGHAIFRFDADAASGRIA